MKKWLLGAIAAFILQSSAKADEGMWIPSLIGKNYDEMKKLGLKLTKEDLYSINNASLKDAVVQFAGGCTGEMISSEGLLLTNHHCGYGAIAALSSVEKNYLDNGFWAKSKQEELPADGVTALFLQKIEDVTAKINAAVGNTKGDKANGIREKAIKELEKEASNNGKLTTNVKSYFNGNQYLLLTYKKYTDVRLVGTPPKSLGKYGGDTDNWMWPRHTADFSIFRVYADENGEPAAFSKNNVPFKPKKHFPISIKGNQEKDYAMIIGYPGRTNRYEVASGVDLALKETNPSIVEIRQKRLEIMKRHMDADKSVYLKLTSRYASISNYWKYFIGQSEQLKRLNVVDKKRSQEKEFNKWAKNNNPSYLGLISDYNAMYTAYRPYAKHVVYYGEAFRATALARIAASIAPLEKALADDQPKDSIDKYAKQVQAAYTANMKDFDLGTDKELFEEMTKMYYQNVPRNQHPSIFQKVILKQYGATNLDKAFANFTADVYDETFLLDAKKVKEFCEKPTLDAIDNDLAIHYALSFVNNYEKYYLPKVKELEREKSILSKGYVKGLMEMNKNELMYPDANSTMRYTYGQVLAYEPQDAVSFKHYTTMEGLLAKYQEGDHEFDLSRDFLELAKKKNYGRYADKDGTMHINFITNNDITGGNSGSPVINANGEIIGCAFDGNWEAMSGDISFDKKFKRTIVVDIRFVLYLIDKLGGAQNLIEEMDIRS
jgi:hypothetical protein